MKKVLIIFGIFITFFIIYFLQNDFFSWFNLAGIKPNLFIIYVLFIGMFVGKELGVSIGIFSGILLDFYIGRNIGTTAIMLGIVGYLGGYLDKNFSKDSKLTIIFVVIGSTCIYEIGKYIMNIIIFKIDLEIIAYLKILLIEIVYQILLTIILYPFMKKVGYSMENIFKENNIMTRYF